ncbi:MAG: AIR synthase family protein [Candidatus Eisenbacteria bacterium]|nr:AIR synthase family protein [Candidatus Eisenbacteria bacterium]
MKPKAAQTGNDLPEIGKISPEIFDEVIFPMLGRKDSSVLVPPQHGVDVGVIDIGGGFVMAITCDPVFVVPQYGWERSAWFAIHILASDAATSGLRPRYLAIDLNLPMSITKHDLVTLWKTMHKECDKLGIAIVAGHTARYEGTDYPMIGGATMMSVGPKTDYITPAMASPDEDIVITKGPAIEASALFAVALPRRVEEAYGLVFAGRAEALFWQTSVVEDALTAVSVGVRENGVTAMHDATECGLWGGLYEVARASRVGMRIEKGKIPIPDEVEKICRLFEIDPFSSISEGTLIITCKKAKTTKLLSCLEGKGILAAKIGETCPEEHGITLLERDHEIPLEHPRVDPFWKAFGQALAAESK